MDDTQVPDQFVEFSGHRGGLRIAEEVAQGSSGLGGQVEACLALIPELHRGQEAQRNKDGTDREAETIIAGLVTEHAGKPHAEATTGSVEHGDRTENLPGGADAEAVDRLQLQQGVHAAPT